MKKNSMISEDFTNIARGVLNSYQLGRRGYSLLLLPHISVPMILQAQHKISAAVKCFASYR